MSAPVQFGLALSSSYPTGTGSYGYQGSFNIVVQNLAYEKQVSIWAEQGGEWQDIEASYVEQLNDGLELWQAPASNSEGSFVARFTTNGTTYWDNNNFLNYEFPKAYDEFSALSGNQYKVILGSANMSAGNLHVDIGVHNIAYDKTVGIVYTTDHWASVQTAYASFSRTMNSGMEVWHLDVPVGSTAEVQFAIFYHVAGSEHWDNNFWRNYTVTPSDPQQWAETP